MIQIGDKDIDAIYIVDNEGVQHEVEAVYIGEEKVWPGDEEAYIIRLVGSFVEGTDETNRYLYINGKKYPVDEEFDFKLNEKFIYTKGSASGGTLDSTYIKSLTYSEGINDLETTLSMFYENKSLQDISGLSNWDTSKVTAMSNMLSDTHITSIEPLKNWDVSAVSSFVGMFSKCEYINGSIDLRNWKTDSMTTMAQMFYYCSSVTSINLSDWNTSKLTTMDRCFYYCPKVTSINLSYWDTSNLKNISQLFYNNQKLKSLYLRNWDFSNVTNASNAFNSLSELTNIYGPVSGISFDLDIKYSPLTNTSAMVLIDGLSDSVTGKKITFKNTTYLSLSPEEKAVATAKGWTVVSA